MQRLHNPLIGHCQIPGVTYCHEAPVEAGIGKMHLYGSQDLGNNQPEKHRGSIWVSFHGNGDNRVAMNLHNSTRRYNRFET